MQSDDISANSNTHVVSMGKEKTFDYFFHQYYAALSFFAQSIIHNDEDAKDIVSDCFVKLWNDTAFIKRTNSVKSFLYTMVRNRCIDYVRNKKVVLKAEPFLQISEDESEYFDELIFAEMMRQIIDHIEYLPNKMSTILKKYYVEGKKLTEIATELSSTPDAVRMQKQRALNLLKRKLLPFYAICTQFYKRIFANRNNSKFALISTCSKLFKNLVLLFQANLGL